MYELTIYLMHVIFILMWNTISNRAVITDKITIEQIEERLQFGDPEIILLLLLCFWTTSTCVNYIRLQYQEFRIIGSRVFRDVWNLLEIFYILFQLCVNVLFFAWPYVERSVERPSQYAGINATEYVLEAQQGVRQPPL